jgi:Xaa-Pro aminopeptidase
VAHTPALAFAVVHRDATVDLFVDPAKLVPDLEEHLGPKVRVAPPDALGPTLDRLGAQRRTVQVDASSTAAWIVQRLTAAGATVIRAADPCLVPKASKNDVELAGARSAHEKDGIALCRFLAWLSREADRPATESAPPTPDASARRTLFRDKASDEEPAPGAIVHYRATPRTDRRIEAGMLYLDLGPCPTDHRRDRPVPSPPTPKSDRSRILRGHITLPRHASRGTTGPVDVLAAPLWRRPDYDRGTGHGGRLHIISRRATASRRSANGTPPG